MSRNKRIGEKIYNLLRKHYVSWDKGNRNGEERWKFLLSVSDEDFEKEFNKRWKNEHGGYIASVSDVILNLPEKLPFKAEDGIIHFPEIPSNDKDFQRKYIRVGNRLLLENDKEEIRISFESNGGGKPEVLFAALLPILNLTGRKVLTYYQSRDGKYHRDSLKDENGYITCISNSRAKAKGTTKKLQNLRKLYVYKDKYTNSAAEQSLIALLSLDGKDSPEIVFLGGRTTGATSNNKWFPLSDNNGIEIPIGWMSDIHGKIYPKGF